MKTNALLIFTRNPELGKVKTRLAKTIGDVDALQVYKDLLQHTMEQTAVIDCDKYVFYDSAIIENDIWDPNTYHKKLQATGDLGQKMQDGFAQLFKEGYTNCIIVGSDLLDLESAIIKEAFNALQTNEVVIGPAEDGGYYLLGMKAMQTAVFKNKDWGTATVFQDTMQDLKLEQPYLLPLLNDIDTYEDLQKSNYKYLQNLEK